VRRIGDALFEPPRRLAEAAFGSETERLDQRAGAWSGRLCQGVDRLCVLGAGSLHRLAAREKHLAKAGESEGCGVRRVLRQRFVERFGNARLVGGESGDGAVESARSGGVRDRVERHGRHSGYI
jgi:hypothetical protein